MGRYEFLSSTAMPFIFFFLEKPLTSVINQYEPYPPRENFNPPVLSLPFFTPSFSHLFSPQPQITPAETARIIRFLVSHHLCNTKRMRVFGAEYAVQWFDYPRSLKCQTVCPIPLCFSLSLSR